MKTSPATPFFNALIGKSISLVWQGHGSALFLEFGQLVQRTNKIARPSRHARGEFRGELTLMIQWSWRIERPRSILGGSWSDSNRWPTMFKKLEGATVTDVQLFGKIPEICVSLSNGLRVSSFMTTDGQPQWAVIWHTPNIGSLHVKRGRLTVETPVAG